MDTLQKASEILRCVGAGKLWDSFESSTIEGICKYICDGFTPTPKQIESVDNVYEKCNIATRLRKHDITRRMSSNIRSIPKVVLPKASKFSIKKSEFLSIIWSYGNNKWTKYGHNHFTYVDDSGHYHEYHLIEDKEDPVSPCIPVKDHVTTPSLAVVPEASETYIQEEEIPLQKHKRKHPRKYMIVDDEDEEQEVQVPRRSTRVQPYSKAVFEDDEEEQEVYEIKEIIGIQNNPISGEVQYLISWKGYTSKSNSWEPKENLVGADCPKLINKFIRNNKI